MTNIALLTDFGSTNTKIVAIDLDEERIICRSQAHSTVSRDITIGYQTAINRIMDKESNLSISDVKIHNLIAWLFQFLEKKGLSHTEALRTRT